MPRKDFIGIFLLSVIGWQEVMGAPVDGRKELLAVVVGVRDSEQSWYKLLIDRKHRGLTMAPKLGIGDGVLGFWAALR
ncbi:Transposase, Mutator family [Bythopirellula goksoeyrii]|uniref:Transposase, Mutator family n=1 Tax=Bythopirellula goksoeyrii TaxID=1400387 RepID=A0A5B9Q5Z2_9BACT|nr:transposase [Bythopirellula goksoeyrii]QEG34407.1 Transposase, Mutator family [Bythopirellula goksoeyrii]